MRLTEYKNAKSHGVSFSSLRNQFNLHSTFTSFFEPEQQLMIHVHLARFILERIILALETGLHGFFVHGSEGGECSNLRSRLSLYINIST